LVIFHFVKDPKLEADSCSKQLLSLISSQIVCWKSNKRPSCFGGAFFKETARNPCALGTGL